MARSTAPRFMTGKLPGNAMSTSLACVLGSAPKRVLLLEKIFDVVDSWAWTSSPMTVSHSISVLSWFALMPVSVLLEAIGNGEQPAFVEIIADQLHADGQRLAGTAEAARDGHGGQAGQTDTQCVDIRQPGCGWIVAIFADAFGGMWCHRTQDDVARLGQRCAEVIGNHAAYTLRLQIVGVVIAVRQHIGAH